MKQPVFAGGLGVVTAIGLNKAENLAALRSKKRGMDQIRLLQTRQMGVLPAAEVKADNTQLAVLAGLSATLPRTALLSAVAAQEAVEDAGFSPRRFPGGARVGFISANTVGGMDKTEEFFSAFMDNPRAGKLRNLVHHECGAITELVAAKLGISGFVSTVSTACSSSANAIFTGARMIRHGLLDIVVAGGADSLTRFTLNGFNTLMILDKDFCRPFDENRRGLNLGEGAGYVVLMSEKMMTAAGRKPYCKLSGYSNANDAYHQTASSPEGTGSFLAMKAALEVSGLHPEDIDYINLHGTGTQNNDIAEGTAIKLLFAPSFPKMSSTKAYTGHTLGACGGVEAVYSALAIRHGIIFPNLGMETPMTAFPFQPETQLMENTSVRHVLSNSFGFGGNCSSLVFSAV